MSNDIGIPSWMHSEQFKTYEYRDRQLAQLSHRILESKNRVWINQPSPAHDLNHPAKILIMQVRGFGLAVFASAGPPVMPSSQSRVRLTWRTAPNKVRHNLQINGWVNRRTQPSESRQVRQSSGSLCSLVDVVSFRDTFYHFQKAF